jgi:type IV pilus assembly protein PilB
LHGELTLVDTLADAPFSSLSGVARVLVHAGKLNGKTAEGLVKTAAERKTSFVSALIAAGSVSAADFAHTLCRCSICHRSRPSDCRAT